MCFEGGSGGSRQGTAFEKARLEAGEGGRDARGKVTGGERLREVTRRRDWGMWLAEADD